VTQTLWIVIVVVAVLIVLAVVLGLVLRRSRRISLREAEERAEQPPRAGTYKAEGGFNFSAGTEEERPTTAPVGERPSAAPAGDASPVAPAAERPSVASSADAPTAPAAERPAPAPQADGSTTAALPDAPAKGVAPVERPAAASAPTADRPATAPAEERPAPSPADASPPAPATTPPPAAAPRTPAAPAPAPQAPASTNGAAASAVTTPAPTDITPPEGRLERLRGRLSRSRSGFGQGLLAVLGAGELDEESWEDVETMLLQADLGPEMTVELVDTLRTELARRGVRTPEQARTLLRDVLTDALRTDLDRSVRALPHDGRPAVLLVVGVNGTGKTTTTGKLARVLVASGRHVVLGAADTFRAAAAEQLATWGERAGATVIRGPEGADPASVAFDAVKQGDEEGADAVLLDTAGRLHTKTGLMDELGKVKRVVSRQAIVDEVLLVLDATTGQNGLTQARVFGDVVDVTGIVLTKLDGTAKGGIVFRVQRELGVPVKLVGLGEGPDDLAPFEPAAFVDALLG